MTKKDELNNINREDFENRSQNKAVRNKKIMNVIVNTSVILMSTLMEGFTDLMMNTMGAVASGMAGAIGGEEAGKEVDEEFKQKMPEVDDKMKTMISEVRNDVYLQIEQKSAEVEPFLSDPKFDEGLKIVEAYDFNLPKLTEDLDDGTVAAYLQLLMSEDPQFDEMFKKLADWMNTMPKSV
jgi:hypothetical protein